MKKAFVFDLDGTLLTSDKKITPRVIDNLQYLYDSSHEIIFASARPPRFVESLSSIFPFDTHLITYNGAMYKTNSGDVISFTIKQTLVEEIINFIDQNDPKAIVSSELNDSWISYKNYDFKGFYNQTIGPSIVPKSHLTSSHCTKILINNCLIENDIKKMFSSKCNIVVTDSGSLIQIMDLGVSKDNALKHLLDSMGIMLENTTCFGDDYNDIGLFKRCGTSVAMGNSIPELKDLATHITTSNDQEGVSRFIEDCVKKVPTL